jgi:hypothetical protein
LIRLQFGIRGNERIIVPKNRYLLLSGLSEGVQLPLGLSQPGVLTGVVLLGVVEKMLLRAELERMEEVASARRRADGDSPERSRSGDGVNPALKEKGTSETRGRRIYKERSTCLNSHM